MPSILLSQRSQRPAVALGTAALLLGLLSCNDDRAVGPTNPSGAENEIGLATTAAALTFRQLSAGTNITCGVTTDNRAYCWGGSGLGHGVSGGSTRPVAVTGGLHFRQVSAGASYACGVTPENRAYCWGFNFDGQLGDGTKDGRTSPVPVAGGLLFRQVAAGHAHTCGWTFPDNRAYCWGDNARGQLGDGTTTDRLTPTAVTGGLQFLAVSPGTFHTCGIITDSRAYCWGADESGQLGNDAEDRGSLRPVLVAGVQRFRQLESGDHHTCGVTLANRAYCWGDGGTGEIGDGKKLNRYTPRAVAGGLSFDRVTTGSHSCGESTENLAYCWGWNLNGELGDGTKTQRLTPAPVSGGLRFVQVTAGNPHTCGVASDGAGYCWGFNGSGQLGDGTRQTRLAPVPVVSP